MESSVWNRLVKFIRDSYTTRFKQASSGVIMGFIASQHLLFAGFMADLVTVGWWVFKGICTVILAFFTSLATSYAAYLIDQYKLKKDATRKKRKGSRSDKAA